MNKLVTFRKEGAESPRLNSPSGTPTTVTGVPVSQYWLRRCRWFSPSAYDGYTCWCGLPKPQHKDEFQLPPPKAFNGSASRGTRLKSTLTNLRPFSSRQRPSPTCSVVPTCSVAQSNVFQDRASWLQSGTFLKAPTGALRIDFLQPDGEKLDKFVYGPQFLRRINPEAKMDETLFDYLRTVWKIPRPSLIVYAPEGASDFSTSTRIKFKKILRKMILSSPPIWVIGDANSTSSSEAIGEVIGSINEEFNEVEDGRYNKPVVSIGVGSWNRIEDVESLTIEVEDNTVYYKIGDKTDDERLNPNKTHYLLIDGATSVDIESVINSMVKGDCPVLTITNEALDGFSEINVQGAASFEISGDSFDEDDWPNKILDLFETQKHPFQVMCLSIAWRCKEYSMKITEETSSGGKKIQLHDLYGQDSLDMDVVTVLEKENRIADFHYIQLAYLFPQSEQAAIKLLRRDVGPTLRHFLEYVTTMPFTMKRAKVKSSFTLLFLYAVLEGRDDLASHFYRRCDSPMLAGLLAAHILRVMTTVKVERDKQIMKELARSYEDSSRKILSKCHVSDPVRTKLLLVRNIVIVNCDSNSL